MKYSPNLHNRNSFRLRGHDYARAGAYFVTICCRNRECLFGEIANGKMILNEYGKIATNSWNELPLHHSNVELREFIAMPNHIHAILEICGVVDMQGVGNHGVGNYKGVAGNAPTAVAAVTGNAMSNISPKPGTLPTIIRSYKSSVSKQIHDRDCGNDGRRGVARNAPYIRDTHRIRDAQNGNVPIWQRNYYEHIIRNEIECARIAEYIQNNPILWKKGRLNTIL